MTNNLDDSNRFKFGLNWKSYHTLIDEQRILEAEKSLKEMLQVEDLENISFLDIGSGSGLFSLAARRLGANVLSFDYDQNSVACTEALKKEFFPSDSNWKIERGSVLDSKYLDTLGLFDIVYSWGVLHHTGAMWVGVENAMSRVNKDGKIYIAIYNDQGWKSRVWWLIKFIYNKLPNPINRVYVFTVGFFCNILALVKYVLLLSPSTIYKRWFNYKKRRGMSFFHDMFDWIGGFPYEFSTYPILKVYIESRGFKLTNGLENKSLGCHLMVFLRCPDEVI